MKHDFPNTPLLLGACFKIPWGPHAILKQALTVWAALSIEAAAQPFGLETRNPVAPFLNRQMPSEQPDAGKWAVVPAFPNLTFQNVVGLVPEPGGNRLCVQSREGRIFAFENDPNVRETQLFLDISSRTQGWDDCGLLGMAFHPEFAQAGSTNRGYVYVFYQFSPSPTPGPLRPPEKTVAYNRLSRFTVPDGSRAADPASELILIDLHDRSVWHNGGAMFFHPDDGFLYLTIGDEGGVDAEFGNAQRLDGGLFSGVLRIDVNQDSNKSHPIRRQPIASIPGRSRTANYYIPNDNPFQDPAGGVLDEFWCVGLRSPHRMTIDPISKSIWLGDVGQGAREEINLIVKGGNYQWAYKEGNLDGPFARPQNLIGIEMPPVHEYSHSRGASILDGDNCVIGGYVYRGREHAGDLEGRYIFGDNGSGRIWALTRGAGGSVAVSQIATFPAGFNYSGLSSFGVDHQNELYLCQMGPAGRIFKLARPAAPNPPPALLSQTGAFQDLSSLRPAAGMIPFGVNSPLWSDAAAKHRWMALPNDGAPYGPEERALFATETEWAFPVGTVFVKHFELPIDDADPGRRKRLETRLLVRDTRGGVYGVTYKWRADDSDADLLPGSLSEDLSITTAPPGPVFDSALDIGSPAVAGSTTRSAATPGYLISTAGSEVFNQSDRFHFTSKTITGDFDVIARLESLMSGEAGARAGLMARESLDPGSRNLFVSAAKSAAGGIREYTSVTIRSDTSGPTEEIAVVRPTSQPQRPDGWLRLRRVANEFTAFAGSNGIAWTRLTNRNLAMPAALHLGLAAAAESTGTRATAQFSGATHVRAQTWYYPSPRDCVTCHTPSAGHVLGVRTSQLNGRFQYETSGNTDNQLRTWNHLQLLQPALNDEQIPALPRLVPLTDSRMPLERRVRSYLAANCAQCHRPGGVRASFDARYETPLPLQGIVNGSPFEPLGIDGSRVVSPGDPARSLLFLRLGLIGENQMPPLARNTIDNSAVAAVGAWINSLPPVAIVRGLRAEYFDNLDLTGPILTRIDPALNFDWGEGSPHPSIGIDSYSVRWSGEIRSPSSGSYTFYTTSDDGIRLWIDDRLVIDNWTDHAPTENRGTADLTAGRNHHLRIEYFENSGGALARLAWSGPGQTRQIISSSRLSTPVDPVFQAPPPLLSVERLGNGPMRLTLDTETTGDLTVEASIDLRQWSQLIQWSNRTGLIEFTDLESTNYHHRFYRAIRPR